MPIKTPVIEPDDLYTVKEVTEMLGLKFGTVWKWIREGKLKYSFTIGTQIKRIKGQDILDLIETK